MKRFKAVLCAAVAAAGSAISFAQLTVASPTSAGNLPSAVSVVGGVVRDLVGTKNARAVSQLAASPLFVSFYDGGSPAIYNAEPGPVGIQTSFNATVLSALGGDIAEASIRFTLFDGDTAAGSFDFNDNNLLLNGLDFGDWSDVNSVTHNSSGTTFGSQSEGGFRNGTLDTGFCYSSDRTLLSSLFNSLVAPGQVVFQSSDSDPFDHVFDFTPGIDVERFNVGGGNVQTRVSQPCEFHVGRDQPRWF